MGSRIDKPGCNCPYCGTRVLLEEVLSFNLLRCPHVQGTGAIICQNCNGKRVYMIKFKGDSLFPDDHGHNVLVYPVTTVPAQNKL